MLFCSLPVCPVSFPNSLRHLPILTLPTLSRPSVLCRCPCRTRPGLSSHTHTQETPLILSMPARALMQTCPPRPRPRRPLLLACSQSAPSASCTPKCASGFPVSASQGFTCFSTHPPGRQGAPCPSEPPAFPTPSPRSREARCSARSLLCPEPEPEPCTWAGLCPRAGPPPLLPTLGLVQSC